MQALSTESRSGGGVVVTARRPELLLPWAPALLALSCNLPHYALPIYLALALFWVGVGT